MSEVRLEKSSSPSIYMFISGLGLLLMAAVAAWANFGVLESMIVDGDTATSLANISDDEGKFRLAILAFLIIALLDVIVAWSLNEFLRTRARALSALAAAPRYVYAGILVIATGFLLVEVQLIARGSDDADGLQLLLDGYEYTWDLGLLLFGCHLLVLGFAIEKAKIAKAWVGLGWIVMIAGAGYLFDSVAVVMNWDVGFEFAAFLFIGEVVLMGWLLWTGFRGKE